MGEFMDQRAATRTARPRLAVIQQIQAQRNASGECAAVHLPRQVIAPRHAHLRRQRAQQAVRQQCLHVVQRLPGQLLLRLAQSGGIKLQAIGRMRGVRDQQ